MNKYASVQALAARVAAELPQLNVVHSAQHRRHLAALPHFTRGLGGDLINQFSVECTARNAATSRHEKNHPPHWKRKRQHHRPTAPMLRVLRQLRIGKFARASAGSTKSPAFPQPARSIRRRRGAIQCLEIIRNVRRQRTRSNSHG